MKAKYSLSTYIKNILIRYEDITEKEFKDIVGKITEDIPVRRLKIGYTTFKIYRYGSEGNYVELVKMEVE